MRILVSGASGFIGSGLVSALASQGHEVCALMRQSATSEFLKGIQFTRITGDLRDQDTLKRACEDVDAVIHLAGLTSAKDREEYFKFNAEGTKNLAQAAAASKTVKKFIYVSSLAAAGPSIGLAPKTETDPDHPVSFYGESKLRGELYLEELKGQLPFVILRPPIVYGPRDRNIFMFFKSIQKNWMPILPSKSTTGHKYYSAIHVDDLIQALALTLNAPETIYKKGERYFVSDGQIYTYERIMGIISHELGVKPIRVKVPVSLVSVIFKAGTLLGKIVGKNLPLTDDKLHEMLPDYWICSSQKAFEQLDFKPKYTMDTGIPQTIAWYKVNGWL
jgi:nucleoside-diphosphate-sugar epimerase